MLYTFRLNLLLLFSHICLSFNTLQNVEMFSLKIYLEESFVLMLKNELMWSGWFICFLNE